MVLRHCVLLVCFAQEIFGYRNCRMSLILLYRWIISEPGNTNCLGSYSFNLCFVVVEETSLSFPRQSFLCYHSLLINPSWCFSHITFLPSTRFPGLPSLRRSEWIQHPAQLALQSVPWLISLPPVSPADRLPASPQAPGQLPAWPFRRWDHRDAPSRCAARSSRARRTQEGSAGVTPSFAPHRGTWHTGGSSTEHTSLLRANKLREPKAHNPSVLYKASVTYLLLNATSPKHFQQLL